MSQLDIFAPPSPIDAAFWKFHRENRHVYEKLVEMTKQAKAAGRPKTSAKMMFEVLRWEQHINTRHDEYVLNNSFTSRYARLISYEYPELASMFESRRL